MKTIQTIIALLAIGLTTGLAPCRAQNRGQSSSPLDFEVTGWDFGNISEDDGAVAHAFEFTNRGPTPVAIDRATASCGCTTPKYPRRPVAPGERASIEVRFDPKGYPGDFSKSITVVSGGGKFADHLTITGHVVPHVKTVEEEFPHEVGGGVRLDGLFALFRTIPQGSTVSMAIKYVNTSEREVSFAAVPVETSGVLDIHAPEKICAGCRGSLTFTYDLSGKTAYGAVHDVVGLSVDGVTSQKTLYTAMTGIDNFGDTNLDAAPRLFLDAQYHNFGEIRKRRIPYTFRITASNEGLRTLHIRSVSDNPGLKTTLRGGMTITPGASLPFEMVFYSDKYFAGELNESIILVVDDPLRPVREIRITAVIK